MWALLIVLVCFAGASWFSESRAFPWWHLFIAPVFPALAIVIAAAGGAHEANGNRIAAIAVYAVATLMWYGLIECIRLFRVRRK